MFEQIESLGPVKRLVPRPVPGIALVPSLSEKRECHPRPRLRQSLPPLVDDLLREPAKVSLGFDRYSRRFIELVDDPKERFHVGPR